MKAIINIYVKQFFTSKIIFLIMVCLIFSIGERQAASVTSYEIYVLNMLTEHYYLTYMMIPIYLLFVYHSLGNLSAFILIRTAYFWKSFLARVIAILTQVISFVGIQVILFLIVGLGLKQSNQFPTNYATQDKLAGLFSQHFPSPVLAIVTVILFMIAGLFTVSVAIFVFHHFFNEKVTLFFIITLYILMTFGIKMPAISQFPLVFINSYIIFHHNFAYPGKLMVTIASMLFINSFAYILVKYYWRKQPKNQWNCRHKGIGNYYFRQIFTRKNILICIGIILIISLWKVTNTSTFAGVTFSDYVSQLFYGHGDMEFHLLSFLEMLIMNSVPLYLLAVFLEEEKRDRNLAVMIRLKHKVSWLHAIIRNGMVFIAFYAFSLIMIAHIMGVIFELNGQTIFMHIDILILKFLDIFFQFLLMFLLYIFTRNITVAFFSVVAINTLSIWFAYIPTGMSSVARGLEMGGLSFTMRMSILLISVLISWIVIRFVSYKKIFQ